MESPIMGWQTHNGKTIGDEPLDLISECINRIVTCYDEAQSRSPSIDEVLECVRHGLNTQGRSLIPELAQLEITGVSIKTKKRPKTQKFEIGDCFAIPIDREFAYGRILKKTVAGHLVEIYDFRTSKVLPFSDFLRHKKRVVWQKHVNGIRAFRNRRWLIIGHQDVPAKYKYAAFYTGTPLSGFVIDRGGKISKMDQLRKGVNAEPMIMFSPDSIENRISSNTPDPWPEVEQVRKRDIGR
jgi:hypothetical protein